MKPSALFFTLVLYLLAGRSSAQTVRLFSAEGYIPAAGGVQLHYRLIGAGKDTIVVIPGGPGFGAAYLIPDLTPLAAHHCLLFIDPAGAGYSTAPSEAGRLSFQNMAEDMETVRRFFRMQKMQLLAHSAGGLFCGYYALAYPNRVKRMLLENPLPAQAAWMAQYDTDKKYDSLSLTIMQRNLKRYRAVQSDSLKACWNYYALWARGHFAAPAEARRNWGDLCQCRQDNLLSPYRYAAMQLAGNWDISDELKIVQAPVLVLGGDRDEIPGPSFEQWQQSLPNSRLLMIKGAGHMPHVDHPEQFFSAAEQFFSGHFPEPDSVPGHSAGVLLPGDARGTAYQRNRKAIIEIENRLMQFAAASQWDSLASLYTRDGTIFPPGAPPVNGRTAIAGLWRTLAQRGMRTVELQVIDLEQSGKLLVAHGKYLMRGEKEEMLDVGKFTAIYRKEKRGWRLQSDMFNTSMETRSPLEIPDYLRPD